MNYFLPFFFVLPICLTLSSVSQLRIFVRPSRVIREELVSKTRQAWPSVEVGELKESHKCGRKKIICVVLSTWVIQYNATLPGRYLLLSDSKFFMHSDLCTNHQEIHRGLIFSPTVTICTTKAIEHEEPVATIKGYEIKNKNFERTARHI